MTTTGAGNAIAQAWPTAFPALIPVPLKQRYGSAFKMAS